MTTFKTDMPPRTMVFWISRPRRAGWSLPWPITIAMLGFVFLIPLETLGHDYDSSSVTLARIAGIVLLISCAFRPRLLLRRPHYSITIGLLLMTLALIRTVFVDPNVLAYAFSRYATWCQMLVFFHIAQPLVALPRLRALTLYAYIAGALATAALLHLGIGLNAGMLAKDRSSLGNLDPNIQSAVLGLAAVWVLVLLLNKQQSLKKPWLLFGLPVFGLLVSASWLTGSRGGFMALFVALISVLFTKGHRSSVTVKTLLLVLGASVAVITVLHNESMMTRLQKFVFEGDTAGRDFLFRASFDLWKLHPVMGWGLGANEVALGGYVNKFFRDMHNSYLYALTAGGAVGAVLLGALLFGRARAALRISDGMWRQIALTGLVFVLADGCTVTILFFKFFWLALVFTAPLLISPEQQPLSRRDRSRV